MTGKKRKALKGLFIALFICLITTAYAAGDNSVSLAGEWSISYSNTTTVIHLPGTMDDANLGDKVEFPDIKPQDIVPKKDYQTWSRRYRFYGEAVYRRELTIPESWKGKKVSLFLERCFWQSKLMIDGKLIGTQSSLCTPHIYDLGLMEPGRHTIELTIDNRHLYDLGKDWSHAVSEQTQPNWNGIIGRIVLSAHEPTDVQDLQVFPDSTGHRINVQARLSNDLPVSLFWAVKNKEGRIVTKGLVSAKEGYAGWQIDLGIKARLWDEFNPNLYQLEVATSTKSTPTVTRFGLRYWSVKGRQFHLNGRPIYLRGTVDNLVFPLTGYPPMDKESWRKIIRTYKEWGLNTMRFHSWCPPEAAFAVADEEGFYLHAEGPVWIRDWNNQPERNAWVGAEMEQIIRTYGNHPSLLIFSVGNENGFDLTVPMSFVHSLKQWDRRHIYAASTAWGPSRECEVDFLGGPIPWLNQMQSLRGHITPETNWDYSDVVEKNPVPMITHELGQWANYPDFRVIDKFTGNMRGRNYELIRDHLSSKGMLEQQPAFTQASGKLAVLLYKDEIEGVRRTKGHCGYELLDLCDDPEQGTSPVGMLDFFLDNKGFITPEEWGEFSGPTCILARFPKRIYREGEEIPVDFEISHYGNEPIRKKSLVWKILASNGKTVLADTIRSLDIPVATLTDIGKARIPTNGFVSPAKYMLRVEIQGTEILNGWDFWVYPKTIPSSAVKGIIVADYWYPELRQQLENGATVFYQVRGQGVFGNLMPVNFGTVFWNSVLFPNQQPMGLICDPVHPAFAGFPTESYMNWQWFDVMEDAKIMDMDELSIGLNPLLQFIPNFASNQRVAGLLEFRVGKGRLLITTLNLTDNLERRPAASLLRRSLLDYLSDPAPENLQDISLQKLNAWLVNADIWWNNPI